MNFRELFNYDPDTGLLTWKISRSSRIKIGQVAGSLKTCNKNKPYEHYYLHVGFAEGRIMNHRIIWEMMTGEPPPRNMQIDHRDGDGTNNRWANLRLASPSQNMGNRSRNKSRKYDLPKGIVWHKRDKIYIARLNGTAVKYSKSLDVVKAAYAEAAAKYFGEFLRI